MYKACIFDLDGTLTDTLESLTVSVNKTLEEMDMPSISSEQCRSFVGNGARRLMEKALAAAGDAELNRIDEGMEVYGRVFAENCTYHVGPYDGITAMLKSLKEQGLRLAVLSNKPHQQSVDVVTSVFGKDTFDVVQGQCDGIPRKPDPTGVFQILEGLGIEPSESIYVGDSDVDMKTGKAAGLFTVGVTWGFRSKELLVETGADITIDHAQELLRFL